MGQDEVTARQTLLAMQERVSRDPYEAMGLTGSPDAEEIRAAFLRLAKTFHPAKFARMSTEVQKLANEVFLALRAAHDTLQRPQVKTPQRTSPLAAPPRGLTPPAGLRSPTPPTGIPTTAARSSPPQPSPLASRAPGTARGTAAPSAFRDEGTQPLGMPPRPSTQSDEGSVRFATPLGRPAPSTPAPVRDEGTARYGTPLGRPAPTPPTPPRDEGSVRFKTPLGRPAPGAADSQRTRPLGTPATSTPTSTVGQRPAGPPGGQRPSSPLQRAPQPRVAASGALPAQGAAAITPPTSPPSTQPDRELQPIVDLLAQNHFAAARAALEVLSLGAPEVRKYRALIAYATGREAQLKGDLRNASIDLNEALQIDPDLQLAKTALAELFSKRK